MSFHFFFFFFFIMFSFYNFYNGVSGKNIAVVNECGFTVWPGILSDPESPFNITGFELAKGSSRLLQAPEYWSGSIWGRTGCNYSKSGSMSCSTGDCRSGEVECREGTYTPPVTIAEFRSMSISEDSYDVSITHGFNVPMTIETTGGEYFCPKMGCVGDLNQQCPKELSLSGGGGCKTACQVLQDFCCKSSSTQICNKSTYGRLFHLACPKSVTSEYNEQDSIVNCKDATGYIVRFCPPSDTFSSIKLGKQLMYNDQLVSVNGRFTLGFFGAESTDYRYLGIWYTEDVDFRKVWVANRNVPIISTSGTHALFIDPNTGNLIITDEGRSLMRITEFDAGPNPNVTATLEDNGNFQLINNKDKRVLWQSFDHPTDVLLPGMKLGYDVTTQKNWTLTSSLSNKIPDTGAFTLSWEPIDEASQRLMIRQRGQPYWTSGSLNYQTFTYLSLLSGPNSSLIYQLTSVYNKEERYFSYDSISGNDSAFPMWVLTPNGQIRDSSTVWTPEFCYGYYSENGCVESSFSKCRREGDTFNETTQDLAPDFTSSVNYDNLSLSIGDCFFICWNDCDCVGFNSRTSNGTGCVIWTGSNSYFVKPYDEYTTMYVISSQHAQSNPTTEKKTQNNRKWLWIIIVAIPLVILSLGLLWYLKQRKHSREEKRKRDDFFLELTASESFKDVYQLESSGGRGNDLLIFSFASISAATCDFSIENKLGQGGFGPVYKGTLHDGQEIAIKRLSRTSDQGLVEFKNELVLITKLQHSNLVRVLGCCIHGEEKMLIYEYMFNKSLDFFLWDENRKLELDWLTRLGIIEGIAQGLLYLHKHSRMRVIHRDLKANNILLDEHMNPKISDFGMARIFKQNETEAMTNRVVGTFGYMSPEYIMEGTFSTKSDIFSFGVLILEIISGKRNSSFVHLDRTFNLIGYAWELWQQGKTLDLKDPTLGNTCVVQQFMRIVHVALLCVQESATDRPTTSDMISMLVNDTIWLPAPKKPAFFTGRVESKSTSDEIKPNHCSINNITITDMDGR